MDVMKTIDDLGTAAGKYIDSSTIKASPRSISSYAAKSIYYFPVLSSKTVIDKTAFMISSNLEAAYSSFVQACFSMVPAVVVKGNNVNVEDYLKIFHKNVGINSGNDYYLVHEAAMQPYELFVNEILNEASSKTAKAIEEAKKILKKNTTPDIDGSVGGHYVDEKGNDTNNRERKVTHTTTTTDKDGNTSTKSDEKTIENRFVATRNFNVQEAEKRNNLKPSIVKVDCTFLIQGNEVKVTIPVGVKTLLHPINSEELCNHVMDSMAGKGLLHNIIKYTTGEIMSLKDVIFGISKIKNTAAKRNTEFGKWVDAIEHRKRLNRLSSGFFAKKPYLPNISLILSMDDINDIEHLIGYNLLKDSYRAVKFMKYNFLLTFVIADEASETVYILYDGHTSYEEVPYSSMRRENERTADAMSAISKSLGIK